jgi:hypothetical protein
LEITYKLGECIDQFFKEHKHQAHSFYVSMHFSEDLVAKEALITPKKPVKENLFRRLFKK